MRPIRPEEKLLVQHLLTLTPDGSKYRIPDEVENLGGGGEGGIQLSSKGAHAADLVEARYRDADGVDVFITLTTNDLGELYDLDLWKADFSPLQRFPAPDQVKADD